MARCLIVAGGCRGLQLARALRARGDAVRITTRDPGRRTPIEAAGAECHLGDPDRVATLSGALAHVGVACLLLGHAHGDAEQLTALHSTRLEMLIERMLDSTVRGIVYEAAGTVDPELLAEGARRVRRACERSLIPYALLEADPADLTAWLPAATGAVDRVLLHPGQGGGDPAGGSGAGWAEAGAG